MYIREATRADARDLAYLINLAGEGLPEQLWQTMAGGDETPLEVGAQRARREEGDFSYRHARVCAHKGRLVGMMVSYPQPAPFPLEDLDDVPVAVQPLVHLEARAPGSWYINALATYEGARGKGVASLLMTQAEALAIAAGCPELSLIVASTNGRARRFFQQRGLHDAASLPMGDAPGAHHGDWVLMTRRLGE
ncbi:N-acetyltransferase family protein [Onishia taeanensis]